MPEIDCVQGESTLDSPVERHRTQRHNCGHVTTEVIEYLSIRITVEHERLPDVEAIFAGRVHAIVAHVGSGGENPHFHIFTPGCKKDSNTLRQRISRGFGAGNEVSAISVRNNGILKALQYGKHEVNASWSFSCDCAREWFDKSPAWDDGYPNRDLKRRKVSENIVELDGEEIVIGIRMSSFNVSRFAANFYKKHNMQHGSLRMTLKEMRKDERYNFTPLYQDRVNLFTEADFLERLGLPQRFLDQWENMFEFNHDKLHPERAIH